MGRIVDETLLQPLSGKIFNDHLKWTSGEGLCLQFYEKLMETPLGPVLDQVALKETEKNWFSVNR